ncbi:MULTISPECIES: GUN4 domain-containing protein [Cyanophyceae]|uniref:GUN4 domain-containing protein n=1 Tax=Leptolyngbya subtilissima DQ-A4 TaxID=2933933 RepID=A0ABV0K531_9CYAN|nr:GUN4 domain-containing protein [Nodosilinea sp. FACHB-141]
MSIDAVTVFFSYSHKDEALRDELANHLEILKWNGDISAWHDRQILPGDEWDREIKGSLNSAQVILLLISSDFIASRYCRDIEITRAMERHESGEACVIPVILRKCMWSFAPFGKLQALPKNAVPVTDSAIWPTKDDAFTNIAEGIRKAANDIRQQLIAARQAKVDQYETTYQQAIQQGYPLGEGAQSKLNRLQVALGLSEADIAPIVTRLAAQYGEARQKLERYRHEVRLCLQEDGGEISPFSRSILNGFRVNFELTSEEAKAVEQEELAPYRARVEAVEQYSKVFADALAHENPPSEAMRQQMQRFQSTLGLSDDDVQAIEAPLLQAAASRKLEQEQADYANNLHRYEQEFIKAVETRYPLSQRVLELLQILQQQLGLSDADIAPIEEPIREAAEARHQQQLRTQEEAEQGRSNIEDDFIKSEEGINNPKPLPPEVSRKDLHDCDPTKILFLKNVRDPNGGWAYDINRIRDISGLVENRVFELFWLQTSKGAKTASKGELMLLNQHAKITHVVEILDDDVRENEAGYFRWVRVVWMPEAEKDWSQLPHQRDIIGFEPPTMGGGTAYSFANLSKFQETWNSLEAFQQHVFQVLTGAEPPMLDEVDESLSSERFGANYYAKLRDLLAAKDWQAADKETLDCLLQVMDRQQKGWLQREDITNFPCLDLRNIDHLWVKYSNGKFGFSVQQEVWQSCGSPTTSFINKEWDKFGVAVGWRTKGFLSIGGDWLLYSQLTFGLSAPKGHLPGVFLAEQGGLMMRGGRTSSRESLWAVGVGSRVSSLGSRLADCSR